MCIQFHMYTQIHIYMSCFLLFRSYPWAFNMTGIGQNDLHYCHIINLNFYDSTTHNHITLQSHGIPCNCNEYTFRPRIMIADSISSSRIKGIIVLIDNINNIDIYLYFRLDNINYHHQHNSSA